MPFFLLAFLAVYSGMHLYAFLKARAAIGFGPVTGISIALFMITMVFAPLIIRQSEKAGFEIFSRLAAYVGYTWLGLLFLFFSCSVAVDLYRLIIGSAAVLTGRDLAGFFPGPANAFYIPLALAVGITVYGYFEATHILTERLTIKSSKIPLETGGLRVVQISDVHLGLLVREDRLNRIVSKIKEADPDILVSTGDLIDGQVCDLNGLSNLLKTIKPRLGKFAITGNHEFYSGFENSKCFTENAGFTLLRGEAVHAGAINIAGIDDPAAKNFGLDRGISERQLLSGLSAEKFTLFLKHRPYVEKTSTGLFDLQLSGHVHKGQIFPFSLVTWLFYPLQSGFGSLSGSPVYVSRGSGTWGPPIRFLSPPEVTVIELVRGG